MNRTFLAVRRRLLQAVPVVFGIVAIIFLLLNLSPGDLVDVMAAEEQISDPQVLEQIRAEYGLDKPIYVQLANYVWNIVHLDLGYSFRHSQPVWDVIVERLPATLILMSVSMALALFIGGLAGVVASIKVNTLYDNLISVVAIIFFAAPSFWIGLMMMVLFSVKLGLLPVSGMYTIGGDYSLAGEIWDVTRHLVMPSFALGLFYAAIYARVMRASMLEVSGLDFIRTARAKGLGEKRVAFKHILRNALLPVVTLFGLQLGTMLAGSVVIESVFSWPGIGTLVFEAVLTRNFPLVMGVLLFGSILVVIANLAVDLVYMRLDPRIELR
ncbi:MAG: ABC transporter permease [Rhodospirillales bacterium]|jgi:peptide/nickel transport system permease protein|nr:ABC transporter permease [Rhodospirillales bacterium]MDP6772701.1 ABC transporter permease [Rhodospirillales bacterium]|tara:strand:- start:484 stop:1461 length:978 start_codon:yes stop_codon:yes gene_type:complete